MVARHPGAHPYGDSMVDKAGEIWGFDASVSSTECERTYLGMGDAQGSVHHLDRGLAFYQLRREGPYRIEVGVGGLDNVY